MKEAMLYERLHDDKVKCILCNHFCHIDKSKKGICGVRQNIDGKLYSLVYGKLVAQNVDPIEKKPMFNFQPGSLSYSIATVGCNFRCGNCQNYSISIGYGEIDSYTIPPVTPEEVVAEALKYDCKSIAYTYTEPTIFFEFAYDTAKLAHENGLKNVFVTNGFMSKNAILKLQPYLDGVNVDLKANTEEFYKEVCKARLKPVLENIEYMRELGIWVEVTTLIIPTLNDDEDGLRELAHKIMDIGADIPWHISAFHPMYKMLDLPRTRPTTLMLARDIGRSIGMRYVYIGNILTDEGENTYCYECKALLIKRSGYRIDEYYIHDSKCFKCGAHIDGFGL